ncbi:MAG: hypothetical protein NTY74_13955 [Ignavibacteriae bacterium]|nr:hypothetical protein [Ignavibacteriota bacterium]
MRIIGFINNPYTQSDFAIHLKDNYSDVGLVSPPVNTDNIVRAKSGIPILQIEFWSNDLLRPYKFLGEQLSYVLDEDSEFTKGGSPWPIFMEVYNSF